MTREEYVQLAHKTRISSLTVNTVIHSATRWKRYIGKDTKRVTAVQSMLYK